MTTVTKRKPIKYVNILIKDSKPKLNLNLFSLLILQPTTVILYIIGKWEGKRDDCVLTSIMIQARPKLRKLK